jgi:hypothetical protein
MGVQAVAGTPRRRTLKIKVGGVGMKNEVIKKMIKLGTEKVNHGKIRLPSYAVVIPSYWLQRVGFDKEERLVSLELKEDRIVLRIHSNLS